VSSAAASANHEAGVQEITEGVAAVTVAAQVPRPFDPTEPYSVEAKRTYVRRIIVKVPLGLNLEDKDIVSSWEVGDEGCFGGYGKTLSIDFVDGTSVDVSESINGTVWVKDNDKLQHLAWEEPESEPELKVYSSYVEGWDEQINGRKGAVWDITKRGGRKGEGEQ
jgi:hypothetical protein